MTVETLLRVICSQKICNSEQEALSDCLCHGYLGRFSLKASFAGGGAFFRRPSEESFVCISQRLLDPPGHCHWGGVCVGGGGRRASEMLSANALPAASSQPAGPPPAARWPAPLSAREAARSHLGARCPAAQCIVGAAASAPPPPPHPRNLHALQIRGGGWYLDQDAVTRGRGISQLIKHFLFIPMLPAPHLR